MKGGKNNMSKNTYFVISGERNGKYYAYVEKVANCYNLKGYFVNPEIITINVCDSKKEAEKIASAWNVTWSSEGKHAFWN